MTNKITWGDTVAISDDAPPQFHPGERGSIAGFRESKENSSSAKEASQSQLCLVEFSDGKAIEIPETFLVKITDE